MSFTSIHLPHATLQTQASRPLANKADRTIAWGPSLEVLRNTDRQYPQLRSSLPEALHIHPVRCGTFDNALQVIAQSLRRENRFITLSLFYERGLFLAIVRSPSALRTSCFHSNLGYTEGKRSIGCPQRSQVHQFVCNVTRSS